MPGKVLKVFAWEEHEADQHADVGLRSRRATKQMPIDAFASSVSDW